MTGRVTSASSKVFSSGSPQNASPSKTLMLCIRRKTAREDAYLTFKAIQAKVSEEKHVKRGPFLAELELQRREIEDGSGSVKIKTTILAYLERFGSAPSCFDDLRPFLTVVSGTEAKELLTLAGKIGVEKDMTLTTESVRRAVNFRKLERWFSSDATPADRLSRVERLLGLYVESKPLGDALPEWELHAGDDFLMLAAHALIDSYAADRTNRLPLQQAICLLEQGVQRSKHNFHFKLLLIRLYFEIGVYKRPLELATSMQIKQVQHDTLSYLFSDDIEFFGCPEQALAVLMNALTIYASNERETPEMIVKAFKHATFSKIPEFIVFRDRLRNSIQRAIATRQAIRVEILRRIEDRGSLTDYLEGLDPSKLDYTGVANPCDEYIGALLDNRDQSILASWTPSSSAVGSYIKGTEVPRKR
ncbi:N-acetyltransferase B complex non catalytic subunit-domain-containing protein, partial [Blyttiomyces helicus]